MSNAPGFAWLDARRTDASDGRYSFMAAWPDDELRVDFGEKRPFDGLASIGEPERVVNTIGPKPSEIPRWIGYVAYDAFWSDPDHSEPRFARAEDPVVFFVRYPALIAIDHLDGSTWIVGDDAQACSRFAEQLETCVRAAPSRPAVGPIEADSADEHRRAILRALDEIGQGNVYEVNLARRWAAPFDGRSFALWEAMRDASRVPLGAFIDAGDHAVLACTMERFLRWSAESRKLLTRPIKGTLARTPGDERASAQLPADPKERAEHVMVVDLMRNDLGRVAEPGSVSVVRPLAVEPFTGLYHLVSTVRCTTREDVSLPAILEATFPPGSVTGAPKIRALQLIEALEKHPRGVYCGSVGFIDRDGGLSLAVAIRTATVERGEVHYWAGGGIVEASDPAREVAETELKARVFLDAVAALRSSVEEQDHIGREQD